jgi:hypothetical protein
VGDDWLPAVVDRSHEVAVEAMLLHDVIADEESGGIGPEPPTPVSGRVDRPDDQPDGSGASQPVTAAAISMGEVKFIVVLVGLTTASGPGESDLVIADMQRRFGVPVVLMGQEDDGTPTYYGNEDLKSHLGAVPVDRMPWKQYTLDC